MKYLSFVAVLFLLFALFAVPISSNAQDASTVGPNQWVLDTVVSPDGTMAVLVVLTQIKGDQTYQGLMLYDITTQTNAQIPTLDHYNAKPVWSADGSMVAFESGSNIGVYLLELNKTVLVSSGSSPDYDPKWLGNMLTFKSLFESNIPDTFIVEPNVDSAPRRMLSEPEATSTTANATVTSVPEVLPTAQQTTTYVIQEGDIIRPTVNVVGLYTNQRLEGIPGKTIGKNNTMKVQVIYPNGIVFGNAGGYGGYTSLVDSNGDPVFELVTK